MGLWWVSNSSYTLLCGRGQAASVTRESSTGSHRRGGTGLEGTPVLSAAGNPGSISTVLMITPELQALTEALLPMVFPDLGGAPSPRRYPPGTYPATRAPDSDQFESAREGRGPLAS